MSGSALLSADAPSLKQQRVVFTVLNLALLSALLILHIVFASFWGKPSAILSALLVWACGARVFELLWLRRRELSPRISSALTIASMGLNLTLSFVLASLVDREDSQYFALLIVPVLEAAFRFGIRATLALVAVSCVVAFYWVWRYFHVHPPAEVGEYFEAGTMSMIFLIVGLLVSLMLRELRSRYRQVMRQAAELHDARERLHHEEKLAEIGRLSSAIAHEVRNPVATISTSLATAKILDDSRAREQMFEIARHEASRLVTLTDDLLAFARPRKANPVGASLGQAVKYIAEACQTRAAEKGVRLQVHVSSQLMANFDLGLTEQILMNLVRNALDAAPPDSTVRLWTEEDQAGQLVVGVENRGGPIASDAVPRLFQPFFTTKPSGTGLGLATSRNAALAQGGDVRLRENSETVSFVLILPRYTSEMRLGTETIDAHA